MTESEKALAIHHLSRMVKTGRYLDSGAHISLPVLHSLGIALDALKKRKNGKWIRNTNGRGGHECNQCNEYAPSTRCGTERLSPYCPNCGVKMEVDNDEVV